MPGEVNLARSAGVVIPARSAGVVSRSRDAAECDAEALQISPQQMDEFLLKPAQNLLLA